MIRDYVARILEINVYFLYYPEPIPGILETQISDRDIKDPVEFGLTNHWKRSMLYENFNVVEHSLTKLVAFYERLHITYPHGSPTGQKRVTDVIYDKSENKNRQNKRKADKSDKV